MDELASFKQIDGIVQLISACSVYFPVYTILYALPLFLSFHIF